MTLTKKDKELIDVALFLAFQALETALATANETDGMAMVHELADILTTRDKVRALPVIDGRSHIGFLN